MNTVDKGGLSNAEYTSTYNIVSQHLNTYLISWQGHNEKRGDQSPEQFHATKPFHLIFISRNESRNEAVSSFLYPYWKLDK